MQTVQSKQKFAPRMQQAAPRAHKRLRRIDAPTFWVSLAAILIILPMLAISLVIISFQVRGINLPNAVVFDKPVGMMTVDQTSGLVDQVWNTNRHILITSSEDPEIHYQVTPKEIGLWVDPVATSKAAHAIGRRSDPLSDIRSALSGQPQVILPVLYFDETTAQETLETIAEERNLSAENARLAFQDGVWVALPGQQGRSLDIQAALDHLEENAFTILLTESLNLHFQAEYPALSDLSPILGEIETVVAQELSLEAYDPINDESYRWTAPIDVKRSWVEVDPETFHIRLNFNQDSLSDLLHSWEQDLGGGRTLDIYSDMEILIDHWKNQQVVQTTVRHPSTTYQVGAGESLWGISLKLGFPMWYIIEANEGLSVNNLSTGMTLTIPSKNDLLPLPVIPNKRIIIDISEQRMQVYENGQLRNTHIISTGVSDSPTMAGVFQIQTHEINAFASNWDLYMPHFMGIYEAWPGFMNGIHGLPLLSSGQRMWASSLGRPVSYGCIILELAAAEDLYYWAEDGVVVEIVR